MSRPTLQGIYPALITPFDDDGRFRPSACERLLDRLFRAEVDGVYICGTTGEGMLQPVAQRRQVAETVLAATPPGKQVIVHVGSTCLAEAIELGRHAASHGATAISSLPPSGPWGFAEIVTYYRHLTEACDLPLLVYHLPIAGSPVTTLPQLLELCALPGVAGVKFTDHNLYLLSKLRAAGPTVFNGYDEVLAAGLLMGADGGIGSFYNLIPELFVALYRHARAEQWEEARQLQRRINELITLTLQVPLFPAIKTMLTWSGIDCGSVLPPRRPLTDPERTRLATLLAHSSFADAVFSPSEGMVGR
ncbi:MAG: dihydrodipicolinate synthase family protein [Blastocatellia bacterium]